MKKATNRILSFLTAFAMVIGVLVAPFTSANAAPKAGTPAGPTSETETTAKVTIHKIKVKNLEKLPIEQKDGETVIKGLDNTTEYDGGKISEKDLKNFFKDKDAEELAKVTFTYWVFDDKDTYEKMVKTPTEYDTVEKVSKEAKVGKGKEITTTTDGATTEQIKVPANSHKFLWAVEKSKTITDDEGKQQTITGAKAVPFGLALPLFKADGNVNEDIHVYPKNTTADEPKVDKDFKGQANANQDRKEIENNIVEGAYVGQVVDYEIETLIPQGAQYKTAAWTDQMTEGLTFDTNMKKKVKEGDVEKEIDAFQVYIGSKDEEKTAKPEDYLVKGVDYELKQDENGFVLEFLPGQPADAEKNQKATGLYRINGQAAETRIHITYSATVNDKAKVERQERNDVIFHYGNEPHHGNTPYPTKPSNGSLTVNKEFTGAEGDWKDGEKVTVTLIDAHTGKPATNLPDGQTAVAELTKGTKESHTWTGLDNDKQYIVKEKFTAGDEVTYVKQDDGSIKIEDRKSDNPTPKDPEEPGVETYGHRFQKIDQADKKGLEGAEFVVINNNEGDDKGKVLAQKDAANLAADQKAYDEAEKEYKEAVAKLTVKGTEITYPEGSSAEKIAELKAKRDAAYVKVNTQWKWIEDKTEDKVEHKGAYVFKSQTNGYFKVTGIDLGSYQLIETKAPDGYAENKTPQTFKVIKGSTGETTKLESGELEDKVGFLQIKNKKVTIPQTGGIGSLIFIVAGLAIMGVAFVAMKRRNAVEA